MISPVANKPNCTACIILLVVLILITTSTLVLGIYYANKLSDSKKFVARIKQVVDQDENGNKRPLPQAGVRGLFNDVGNFLIEVVQTSDDFIGRVGEFVIEAPGKSMF